MDLQQLTQTLRTAAVNPAREMHGISAHVTCTVYCEHHGIIQVGAVHDGGIED